MTAANTTWLQATLSDLLASPHISIRSMPGIRMGPGPVDIFSTKFNNIFSPEVKATVSGQVVDRAGLKEKLLGLQQHYVPESAKFHAVSKDDPESTSDYGEEKVVIAGESKDLGAYEVSVSAEVTEEQGNRKITSVTIHGKPELFVRKST